jgi:hypothetical protein
LSLGMRFDEHGRLVPPPSLEEEGGEPAA